MKGIFFCTVNFIVFFAGTFLNIVVVLSIWKSTQLQKKTCYFTIFILSSFDLATVIVNYPLLIFWYIAWYIEDIGLFWSRFFWLINIGSATLVPSLLGLLTMTLERYLGLTYSLLHKTSVTKKRLAAFLFAIQTFPFISCPMNIIFKISYFDWPYIPALFDVLFILVAILNCRIFSIAKSRQKAILSNGRKGIMEYKKHYTCISVVGIFFISCTFTAIYNGLILSHLVDASSRFAMCLFFWASTAVTMTSTINSVIFFWLNKVLRNEGQKLLKGCGFSKLSS